MLTTIAPTAPNNSKMKTRRSQRSRARLMGKVHYLTKSVSGRIVTGVLDRARLAELAAHPAVASIDLAPSAPSR